MTLKKINVLDNEKKIFIILGLLLIGGIIIRLFFTPFFHPLSLDAVSYFVYGYSILELGEFSLNYLRINFGWPIFLSIFFATIESPSMLELMNMQRIISIIISTLTVFPIYKLCRLFSSKNIALIGTTIFVFEPHLIENSINGNTESLFIFLIVSSLYFSFKKNSNFVILAFICGGLASAVRYEGLLLFLPIISTLFLKNTISKKFIIRIGIGIIVFFLIVILFSLIGFQDTGQLSIINHVFAGGNYITNTLYTHESINAEERFSQVEINDRFSIFLLDSLQGYAKFLAYTLIPIIGPFLILAIFFLPRKITKTRISFFIFFIILSIAGFYAYGRGIEDSRYIFPIIPIFIVIVSTSIGFFIKKNHSKNLLTVIMIGIVCTSFLYVYWQQKDFQEENEIFQAAQFVVKNAEGVNDPPGGRYNKIAELKNNWPLLPSVGNNGKIDIITKNIDTKNFDDIQKYLKNFEGNGLTHIITYNENSKEFLTDIFINEEAHPYLKKVYDSKELEHKKQIKIFEIDYEKFNQTVK